MKFEIRDLGPIKEAGIEVGDLTIVCGRNNAGKTYLTYSLYSFLATIRERLLLDIPEACFEDCCRNLATSLDLEEIWSQYNARLATAAADFSGRLPFFLALSQSREGCSFQAVAEEKDFGIFVEREIHSRFQVSDSCNFLIDKEKGSSRAHVGIENMGEHLPRKENLRKMFQRVCSLFVNEIIPDVFSLTSERTGASIFKDELANVVSQNPHGNGTDGVRRIGDPEEIGKLPYPLPLLREIEFFLRIGKTSEKESFVSRSHPGILEAFSRIADGEYIVDEYEGIQFAPGGGPRRLALSESSSSVKSLVELNFYLRNCARRSQVLMIDEPELNLHPENQRRLARLLALLVDAGVRVFITTHSDYMIREFDFMVRLFDDIGLARKLGYSPAHLLKADQVKAYVVENHGGSRGLALNEIPVSRKLGLESTSFDRSIEQMNDIQQAIQMGEFISDQDVSPWVCAEEN